MTGNLIRARREALGLTQADLARAAKVPAPYVSHAEHGRCATWALTRIKQALDVREEWNRRCRALRLMEARITHAWATAPDCELVRLLRRQLVGRAWRLLEDGNHECADRLLELLPTPIRDALLHYEFETDERYPAALLTGAEPVLFIAGRR